MKRLEKNVDMGRRDGDTKLAEAVFAALGKDGQFPRPVIQRQLGESINQTAVFFGFGDINDQDVGGVGFEKAHGLIGGAGGEDGMPEVFQEFVGGRVLRRLITRRKNDGS